MATLKLACVVTIISFLLAAQNHRHHAAEAAVTCGAVVSRITSCFGYVQRGGAVPISCCDGLRALNTATATTPDLQAACRCLTALIPSISPRPSLINSLPDKRRISFPYRYSPLLDCSKLTR